MPPELPNEQELTLKKRARRRLVGAVALVLLMIIILPQVLQDRALQAQQEPIKITMPEAVIAVTESIPSQQSVALPDDVPQQAQSEEAANDAKAADKAAAEEIKPTKTAHVPTVPVAVNRTAERAPVSVAAETKPTTNKTEGLFAVQVGVYSDAANVKRLQEQLKQAGFNTHTEKVQTPKGESLRLKAGSFKTRQDATDALAKIKALGMPGMVITDD